MSRENNGPAYPSSYTLPENWGVTLRDYFAARAMQAILTKPESIQLTANELANAAYEMADEMMKVRSNT